VADPLGPGTVAQFHQVVAGDGVYRSLKLRERSPDDRRARNQRRRRPFGVPEKQPLSEVVRREVKPLADLDAAPHPARCGTRQYVGDAVRASPRAVADPRLVAAHLVEAFEDHSVPESGHVV